MREVRLDNKTLTRWAREKKALVPNDAVELRDEEFRNILDKACFQSSLRDELAPRVGQDLAHTMLTHLRTIVSKAHTEVFEACVHRRVAMSEDELRQFSNWFNELVGEYLQESQELMVKWHRELHEASKETEDE